MGPGESGRVVAMAGGDARIARRELDRIFRGESVAGLTDAQLLDRFAGPLDDEAGARAFEALVDRHGPLVLGVCRRTLRDPRDVEDAFQATFLVLIRKARSVRVADSLAPWLFGVARRVSTRARVEAARRAARERPELVDEPAAPEADRDEVGPVLLEEIDRLPERVRRPVVLCYLEGLTHDQAAGRLRCPVGTVRSRLAWARDRLRTRLTRRGVAPSAAILASTLHPAASRAAVPGSWIVAATRAAFPLTVDRAVRSGLSSAAALALAQGVLTTMNLTRWIKLTTLVLASAGALASGAWAYAWSSGDGPDEPPAAGRDPDPMPPKPVPVAEAKAPDDRAEPSGLGERAERLVRAQTDLEALRMDVEALREVLMATHRDLKKPGPSVMAGKLNPSLVTGVTGGVVSLDDEEALQEATRRTYLSQRIRLRRKEREVEDLSNGLPAVPEGGAASDDIGDQIEGEDVDLELATLDVEDLKQRLQAELSRARSTEFSLDKILYPDPGDEQRLREMKAQVVAGREQNARQQREKAEATQSAYLEAKFAVEAAKANLARLREEYDFRWELEQGGRVIGKEDSLAIHLDPVLSRILKRYPYIHPGSQMLDPNFKHSAASVRQLDGNSRDLSSISLADARSTFIQALRTQMIDQSQDLGNPTEAEIDSALGLIRPDPGEPGKMIVVPPAESRNVRMNIVDRRNPRGSSTSKPLSLPKPVVGDLTGKLERAIKLLEELKAAKD